MKRRRMFQAFKAANETGNYTELPMLPSHVDPQVYLSRNSVAQPFHLICGKDSVIAQLSGEALLHLKSSSVNTFKLEPGDNVYIPAGTPHRIVPLSESVQLRYKAQNAGLEGVAWFCPDCSLEIGRVEWDTDEKVSQRAYLDACETFNSSPSMRSCPRCGAEHPTVVLEQFETWPYVAAALEDERAAAEEKASTLSAQP